MKLGTDEGSHVRLEASHLEDIQLASSKMTGADRRAFHISVGVRSCI